MRVAVVHSFYSSRVPSGENEVVTAHVQALEAAGHDVLLVAASTDVEEHRALNSLRAAVRVASGRGGDPSAVLAAFRPDVVHVHNLFPNLGTHWVAAWPGPLVATLHNFRLACANGLLFRDGAPCTECPDGRPLAGLAHACYRDSRLATLPVTIATARGMAAHPLVRRADRIVSLSDRSRALFERFGVPSDRLVVIPNFVDDLHGGTTTPPVESRYVAVGRLTPEKGFASLVTSWPRHLRLDLVGDGPEAAALARIGHPAVRLVGALDREQWRRAASEYTGMVVPSLSSEGAVPLTVLEAWEASLPVIARRGSSAADAVEGTRAGFAYADDASLARAIDDVERGGAPLRDVARRAYESSCTPATWVAAMTGLYREVLSGR